MITFSLLLFVFFYGCASAPKKPSEGVEIRNVKPTYFEKIQGQTEDIVVFATAYGEIPKDASMPDVMSVFGNPDHIDNQGSFEVWRYGPEPGKTMFIYFLNEKVKDIKTQDEQ